MPPAVPAAHAGKPAPARPPIVLEADGVSVVDTWWVPSNAGNGTSVEKVSGYVEDVVENWQASTCASGSSPGVANCVSYTRARPADAGPRGRQGPRTA